MKSLYLDCFSGISGDMTVAALLDLGASREALEAGLASLGLEGWTASVGRGMKGVLAGATFRVEVDEGRQVERSLREIEALITAAPLPPAASDLALRAFRLLGEAEARIHGIPVEEVHFHEVGAVDSIIDLVGAALCLVDLAPDEVIVSPVPLSRGFIRCRHGLLPLPAPAALDLAKGVPVCKPPAPTVRELCTPTGLALIRAMATGYGDPPAGVVKGTGYGLGRVDLPWPNALRVLLLERSAEAAQVVQLEANLDDATGEALAHAVDRALAEGALDAWLAPVLMKKGRPGFVLGLLCEPADAARLTDLVLRETPTLGVRRSTLDRTTLAREIRTVPTEGGEVRCKVAFPPGAPPRVKPEHEDCLQASLKSGLPLAEIVAQALRAAGRP